MLKQPDGIGSRCPAGTEMVVESKTAGIHMVAEMEAVMGLLPALELLDLQAATVYQTGWFSFGES